MDPKQKQIPVGMSDAIRNIGHTTAQQLSQQVLTFLIFGVIFYTIGTGGDNTYKKLGTFFFWIFVVTVTYMCSGLNQSAFGVFILCFSFMYFLIPMINISYSNNIPYINFGVIFLFLAYIIFDIIMLKQMNRIPSIFSLPIIVNVITGLLIGIGVAMLMYYAAKQYLYILNTNSQYGLTEVPKEQVMRCEYVKQT
jgi:hypothetical protein